MNYALVGYGRMGRAVEDEARSRGHRLVEGFDVTSFGQALDGGNLADRLGDADVVFEFTIGTAAEGNVRTLLEARLPVVCGTTGWKPSADLLRRVTDATTGVVIGPNFSVGMNLFYRLVREASVFYGVEGLYQPYVVEWHHRAKQDLPSGTARRLSQIVVEANPRLEGTQEGDPKGPVAPNTVHVTGVRAGEEAGTHDVGFDGKHDVITLRHRARSRAAFAAGAVLAAEWVIGKPGLHDFDAVLDDLLGPGLAHAGAPDE